MEDLFSYPKNSRARIVQLPMVRTFSHKQTVRNWLLEYGWLEYEDWMIAHHNVETGIYEVWFSDIGKAVYFKLSFSL